MTARTLSSGQAGFTLIELLVTVAILATAFIVFAGGIGTAILASDYHRRQASAEALLRNYAEAVKAQTYVSCAAPTSYQSPSNYSGNTKYTAAVTKVRYWNSGSYADACPTTDAGLQLVSLLVTSKSGRDAEAVDVIKRKP